MKLFISCLLLLVSIQANASVSPNYHQITNDYFQTYKVRKDFDKFLTFYAPDLVFEDVFYQVKLSNKQQFVSFYDWGKGNFDRLGNEHIMRLDNIAIEGNQAVAKGEFLRFGYNGKKMGPWRFVIWLEFDKDGKIVKQQDWINYSQQDSKKGNY